MANAPKSYTSKDARSIPRGTAVPAANSITTWSVACVTTARSRAAPIAAPDLGLMAHVPNVVKGSSLLEAPVVRCTFLAASRRASRPA